MFGIRNNINKYYAVFLRKNGKTFEKIIEKKFDPTKLKLKFRDKTFLIPKELSTYNDNKKCYVFFDFINESVITFSENTNIFDAKTLDKIISQSVFSQMISALKSSMGKPDKWKILPFIIAFAFGAVVGYVVCDSQLATLATTP